MPGGRQPGHLCQSSKRLLVKVGTSGQTPSARPMPLCATRSGGVTEFARRVENVRDALIRGLTIYARAETEAELGADRKLLVASLWPGFIQAVEVYAWSVGTFAVL